MTRFHLKMRQGDFPAEVIRATELLFDAKPWRLDLGQLDLYQRWADVVCDAYNVPAIGIQKVDVDALGFEYVPGVVPNILIGRYSLTTLFCAVGAHILMSDNRGNGVANVEWAYSLFYIVRPVMFRRRAREGRILNMTAKDTFSRDTWDRLENMGLTMGDFLLDSAFDIRTLDADDDLTSPDDEAEADEANEDIASVVPFPTPDLRTRLERFPITILRKLSKNGLVPNGYSMSKEMLVDWLLNADRILLSGAMRREGVL